MSLNDTPSGERLHIGFFGERNAGKSSLVNAVTGQKLSLVSDVKGTTTDPVRKAMELLPIGPVLIIDTPGFDDEGFLGELRVEKTQEILDITDVAVLVVDGTKPLSETEYRLITIFKEKSIPYIIAINKSDLLPGKSIVEGEIKGSEGISIKISALTGENIHELKELIGKVGQGEVKKRYLVSDLVERGDVVILVIPIDESAPKGRIILPQQQVLRDLLDKGAIAICLQPTELKEFIDDNKKMPSLVITDSQVFHQVSAILPKDIHLTSFSILMARYKGFLNTAVKGISAVERLKDGDKILISEGCTHHRQCNDIGTVKLPMWIKTYINKDIIIETSSGRDFPKDLSGYTLVIHCGGCMLTEKDMYHRMKIAVSQNIPFTNYGIAIAYTNGIIKRSVDIFPYLQEYFR